MERRRLGFETIALTTEARISDIVGHHEQENQITAQATRREVEYPFELLEIEATPESLICERRVDEAIADYVAARRERGFDDRAHVLCLVGGDQQCLCARVEVMGVGIEHDLAHQLAEFGRARLEGEQRSESIGEAAGLRRLATGFTAFEDD